MRKTLYIAFLCTFRPLSGTRKIHRIAVEKKRAVDIIAQWIQLHSVQAENLDAKIAQWIQFYRIGVRLLNPDHTRIRFVL